MTWLVWSPQKLHTRKAVVARRQPRRQQHPLLRMLTQAQAPIQEARGLALEAELLLMQQRIPSRTLRKLFRPLLLDTRLQILPLPLIPLLCPLQLVALVPMLLLLPVSPPHLPPVLLKLMLARIWAVAQRTPLQQSLPPPSGRQPRHPRRPRAI